jgi:hypothetical protein
VGDLQDTVWSLNLLFPANNKEMTLFFQNMARPFTITLRDYQSDYADYEKRLFDLNELRHWRRRLYVLRQLYIAEAETSM